jgi:hypothetical protein
VVPHPGHEELVVTTERGADAAGMAAQFVAALGQHRFFQRQQRAHASA